MHAVDLLCFSLALALFILAAIPRVPLRDVLMAAGLALALFPTWWATVQAS